MASATEPLPPPCTRLPPGVVLAPMTTQQGVALMHRPADERNQRYLEFLATFGKVVALSGVGVPLLPIEPAVLGSSSMPLRVVVHCVVCARAIDSSHSNVLRTLFFNLDCGHCLCAACVLRVIGISACPNLALLDTRNLARLTAMAGSGPTMMAARLATGIPFDDALCQGDPMCESPALLLLGAGAKLCGLSPYVTSMLECAWPPCGGWGASRCGSCLTPYCSKACQRAAWTATHKQPCQAATRLASVRLAASQADLKEALAFAPAACPCDTCARRRAPA